MSTLTLLNLPDTMTDDAKITRLEKELNDSRLWQAEHDGRINAYWKAQHAWNHEHDVEADVVRKVTDKKIAAVDGRLSSIEKKIIWITAIAAAGGGSIGPILQALGG